MHKKHLRELCRKWFVARRRKEPAKMLVRFVRTTDRYNHYITTFEFINLTWVDVSIIYREILVDLWRSWKMAFTFWRESLVGVMVVPCPVCILYKSCIVYAWFTRYNYFLVMEGEIRWTVTIWIFQAILECIPDWVCLRDGYSIQWEKNNLWHHSGKDGRRCVGRLCLFLIPWWDVFQASFYCMYRVYQ